MFGEVLTSVAGRLAEGSASGSPSSAVTVAAIGAGSLIITSLIAGWFGTRGDRRGDRAERDRAIAEAELSEAHAENERRDATTERDHWHRRYEVLCAVLWRRRLDPNKFVTGEESDDVARF